MSILSKLFGGGAKPKTIEAVEHDGFRIFAEPMKESGGFRIAARIEKDFDGEIKTHQMIRADVSNTLDEATSTSVNKAKAFIDQQGDRIFG